MPHFLMFWHGISKTAHVFTASCLPARVATGHLSLTHFLNSCNAMKLFSPPKTKRVLSAIGVAVLAGVGLAQAQYTGIGTTAPNASLHVKPINATDFTLRLEGVIDANAGTTPADSLTAYNNVLVLEPASGYVKRLNVEDLVQNSAEWVYNAGADHIEPRRYATSINVDGTDVVIGAATTANGTLVTNSTLTANDAATFNSTVFVTGTVGADDVTFGNTQTEANTTDGNFNLVMIQNAAGVVRNIDIADLLDESGEWVYNDNGTPANTADDFIEPRRYPASMDVSAAEVTIGVATTVDATLTVSGATTLNAAAQYNGPADGLDIDNLTTETNPRAAGFDLVLIQDANGIVRNIDVGDLLEESGEWVLNAGTDGVEGTADDFIEPRRYAGAVEVDGSLVDIGVATKVDNTLNVVGATTLDATLDVDGATTLQQTLLVNGAATFDNSLTVNATGGPDHVTFGGLGDVTDVMTAGVAGAPSLFERVLITDHEGVVRYINAADLVSSASEWVYEDNGAANTVDAADRIYVRRIDGGTNDVYVDGVGNLVLSSGEALQFGSSADQITADGTTTTITSANDVNFTEAGSTWMFYDADANGSGEQGRVGINTNNPQATLHVEGNIVASNTTVSSDQRFKRDIRNFDGALAAITSLRGVSYEFRHDEFPQENFDEAEHLGFIAQEIREVLPQTVFEREDGFLTVDYGAVTPVLVEAVKELNAKVTALQQENASLRGNASEGVGAVSAKQLGQLEAQIATLTARLDEVAGRK